jgi:DNA-binding NtrC family response regulator
MLARLQALPWSGNVRELKNVVERAAILADTTLEPETLPLPQAAEVPVVADSTLQVRIGTSLGDIERSVILSTLESLEGNKRRTAEVLGISLKTLYNRLNVYDAQAHAKPELPSN